MTNTIEEPIKLHITIPCEMAKVKDVRDQIGDLFVQIGYETKDKINLDLVINEAVANAVDHGSYQNKNAIVDITIELKKSHFTMIVKDYGGIAFNPAFFERIAARKTWGKGGRGIGIMTTIMDEVYYLITPHKSTLLYLSTEIRPDPADALRKILYGK